MNDPLASDEALLAKALERPATERAAFLDDACTGDPARRARLEDLIQRHGEAQAHATENAAAFAATQKLDSTSRDEARPAEVGSERIGRYKLLQKLGEGGCGTVYMAEQNEPVQRRVALKIIKLGMDTEKVIARFEVERQVLAINRQRARA